VGQIIANCKIIRLISFFLTQILEILTMKPTFLLLFGCFFLLSVSACRKSEDCEATAYDGRACYEIYAPVCGCNGVTYSNDCDAEAHGITIFTQGACR